MQHLKDLVEKAKSAIEQIENKSLATLDEIRVEYFGKKGHFTQLMQELRNVAAEERPAMGAKINEAKQAALDFLNAKKAEWEQAELNAKLEKERIDVSLPGRKTETGGLHPVTITINRVTKFFSELGFSVETGPEIESDYYNFDALNIPKHHPARADHDTFWFNPELLLRTQTSGVQIRTMEKMQPPIRIMAPGRVYRNDYDQTHTPMFHQIELLYVDKKANFTELKGLLHDFLRAFFEEDLQVRFRPSYFPFTEPSVEVDVSCFKCGGKGCNVCKKTGWIEILGAGMVHPQVLEMSGVDSEEYSGFAFGLGQERIAMLRYGINDIRGFYQGDVRFSEQFK